MKHFGTIVFGSMTALSALAVHWLSHGAGTGDPHASVFGIAVSPILHLVFTGPFALLFFIFLLKELKQQ
jgi:hypothetical protein